MKYACNMDEHGMLCQIKGYTREFGVIPVVLRSNLSKGQSHTASAHGKGGVTNETKNPTRALVKRADEDENTEPGWSRQLRK